ncbi:MAG TPA: EAL domain-containing protein [Xanthomonadaceae bacterium]|jgi:EAL domain-containing protein (putative c-di-GMP-specific phosphodiesterase class I)/HAMP domain-containing protein|nr:EAL domain-containing protein [Xanthomonadaceae bacterium]
MRFGLQARFIAILLLAGAIALGAVFVLHRQLEARDRAVAEAVQNLIDLGGVRQANQEQMQGEITARIEAADHSYRVDLSLTVFVFGLLLAGVAWLAWQMLVRPILGLAEIAQRIEAGDEVAPLVDSQRDDEIGDLACAFNTLNDALIALRQRMDHDAGLIERAPPAPVPDAPSTTMVMKPPAPKPAAAPSPAPPTPAPKPAPPPQDIERQRRLEDDLREAWQRGEMSVLYQPIHSVADGSMRGAEALLRWQHRIEGAISPHEFIPLAERSDLIVALGRHVLVQACSDAGLWPGDGTPEHSPFISVNVSERQLRDQQMFEYVVEALRKSGLAASRLHLEMQVSVLRDGDPAIEAMLEQLRGLGVQIWLDATGADASDQERWMKAPVSGVKVGRSRIQGKTAQAADMASTGAIVATARALRIVAVVVGVEELSELNVLKEQGADLAQGYVLCKPVGTAEIGRRLLA